ncbi:gastrula zinc finger protein XlCGF57.1-like [Agrilus planipennis]|uniref:Gastrula zinc finger protein XlCGF57.1-like n=1 Tax=Agrilus planipennis TaxID=224129 RepID=A0A1W4XVG5_AGRPL|nr:gastrula zinc finger protein XlCGF57.1-like [Agrilus planipennis]
MQIPTEFCCTCLKSGTQLNNTLELDSKDVDYTTKLRFCVPEVEWSSGYICKQCSVTLNQCYSFKEQCLKANEVLAEGKFHFLLNVTNNENSSSDTTPNVNQPFLDNFVKSEHGSDDDGSDYKPEADEDSTDEINSSKEEETIPPPKKSKLNCSLCDNKFPDRHSLLIHKKTDHKDRQPQKISIKDLNVETNSLGRRIKKHQCQKCGKKYTTVKILNSHASICDGIKRHTRKDADDNEDEFFKRPELFPKNKDATKQKVVHLTCEFCEKVVGAFKKYVAHCVEEHNSNPETLKPYLCKVCKQRFSTSTHLSRHRLQHSDKKAHMCTFCGKGFKTRKDILRHEKIHTNKREVQCELCPKRFNTKNLLNSHKLVVHTDPMLWNYVCQYCGKRFPMKSNYDAHTRRHTGEKPFACHLCDKRFGDKSVLQQHFHSHSNIRAFKCDYCGKEYKSMRVLGIHLKKVHEIGNYKIPVRKKKFTCDYCSKAFAARDKLRRHMCSHTRERPYACHICEERFTDKSYVKQHLKSVHNLEVIKQD